MGILCAAGDGAVCPPPFAGQAGFVAEDLDADPDRHPHARAGASTSMSTRFSPNGSVRFLGRVEAARVRTQLAWAVELWKASQSRTLEAV